MDAVLLDTDVFSYLLRAGDARGEPYRKHVQGKTIVLSFVTLGELYYGAIKRGWSAKTLASLEQRLKVAVVVPYDTEICKTYGRLRATLRTASGSHRSVFQNDLWIAACAVRHSLPLVTTIENTSRE
ncbi:MAG TPA: PIN domain-containing protein [Terriglobia bacterium]|nr:PIN domain-containing protein [Terriglobia bacterium]